MNTARSVICEGQSWKVITEWPLRVQSGGVTPNILIDDFISVSSSCLHLCWSYRSDSSSFRLIYQIVSG
jgi:hypothetical protein